MDRKLGLTVFFVLCTIWQVNAAVNCTATGAGRFTDGTDPTCQNYTYCVFVSSNSSYLAYNYVCPSTSVFNPASAKCTASTNYVCNVTTPAPANTSVCTADGFVADPNAVNCSSYIQCVQINGTFDETTFTCPANTFYDPNTTLCDSNYTCTTNTPPAANTTTAPFTCSTVGRFANSADTACKTYYYCVLANNGTFVQYNYTCPTTSVFSPTSRLCTTSYTCPTS
ncbi:probable endochitinase [Manduca sexta]|uniref:Chitin-binding type-2 domain-containing protein n=1 Tax=Manduca sexta TaxID=7130 RepID=A0A922CLK1_MANSE|nr:probable endochitinase [Manduca sexta]KAG6450727.1 hypothetical protein O3G_MSEX006738 [Manduca sexta]